MHHSLSPTLGLPRHLESASICPGMSSKPNAAQEGGTIYCVLEAQTYTKTDWEAMNTNNCSDNKSYGNFLITLILVMSEVNNSSSALKQMKLRSWFHAAPYHIDGLHPCIALILVLLRFMQSSDAVHGVLCPSEVAGCFKVCSVIWYCIIL